LSPKDEKKESEETVSEPDDDVSMEENDISDNKIEV